MHLQQLDPLIGNLFLNQIHNGTLKSLINYRLAQERKKKTINLALEVVRRILNLAALEWIDEYGLTWLEYAPKIKMLHVLGSPYGTNLKISIIFQHSYRL